MSRDDLLRRAGIVLPAGAKSLKTKLPKATSLLGQRYAPGTLLVTVEVPHRPIPWKAPSTTRTGHSYKDPKLVAWQRQVGLYAGQAMAGLAPYRHPVKLDISFHLTRAKNGSIPDLSNLTKAFEDALQGTVIVNDCQVASIIADRYIGTTDGAVVDVYARGDQ